MVRTPSVIRAVAVRGEGPREIGRGECGDGAAHVYATETGERTVEISHPGGDLRQQIGLGGVLEVVRVPTA